MAVGVPSTNPIYQSSTEGLIFKSKGGVPQIISGVQYIQYGAGTAIANTTTETSLFAGNTASFGQLSWPAGGLTNDWNLPNLAGAGAVYRLKLGGAIGNTATPTLTVRLTLTNAAGTVSTLSTSGAVTMATITTGLWSAEVIIAVTAYNSSTGSVYTAGGLDYFTAAGAKSSILLPGTTLGSIDTTGYFALDAKATWGAASASNTITTTWATLEALN